ncbi:hypothetical protein BC833DRAFT_570387 [Globomyces pollinis-pini]|nr:hypothetical protein BC833DRAFT_570387 [Globomyces pollinis-pini]
MSQPSVTTLTGLAFVNGIAYPITIFTVISAALQLKKNRSYRVINIFLSSFFLAFILLTYPLKWSPQGVSPGLRLLWFIASGLATPCITVAGVHRYTAVITNARLQKICITIAYVIVFGLYSAIITSSVLFSLGKAPYNTTVNSLAIIIPIGHIILTIFFVTRTQWNDAKMESFSFVSKLFAILIGVLWSIWIVLLFTISAEPIYLAITLLLQQLTVLLENRILSLTETVYSYKKDTIHKSGEKSLGLHTNSRPEASTK